MTLTPLYHAACVCVKSPSYINTFLLQLYERFVELTYKRRMRMKTYNSNVIQPFDKKSLQIVSLLLQERREEQTMFL
jgi:riboflavin transporter FmnP